jgi:hypothetical protein
MHTDPDPIAPSAMLDDVLRDERRQRRAHRLARSALHFYRGTLPIMTHHLAGTPTSGLMVQLNGDANLANFGLYTAADGRLEFDLTDFHETHPGPWEWDLFRLVVDLVVSGRTHGFSSPQRNRAVTRAVIRYRRAMIGFACLSDSELRTARPGDDELRRQRELGLATRLVEARSGRSLPDERPFRPHVRRVAGRTALMFDHSHVVLPQRAGGRHGTGLREFIEGYTTTLDPESRTLIEGYELTDVTAVRSPDESGDVSWFLLFVRRATGEPLVLQATVVRGCSLDGVLGLHGVGGSHGERVVLGQRLTQVAPDPLAGWQRVDDGQAPARDYHVRQLRDRIVSAEVARMASFTMSAYGELCAWTLAHGHARTGDRAALAAHLSADPGLEDRLAESAEEYADQNERDHRRFAAAVCESSGVLGGPDRARA